MISLPTTGSSFIPDHSYLYTVIAITFPPYQPRIREQHKKPQIFDGIRKQWVALTPEEWVRQNILQYLTLVLQYPASLIAVEKEIRLGELKKRCDIIVYDRDMKPFLLVECKEMEAPLTDAAVHQALRYNQTLQVPYFAITNGQYTCLFKNEAGQLVEVGEWPGLG